MTRLGLFLAPVFFMIKNKVEIESYSFVLEPSYRKDGSIHSWEILTKKVTKKHINDELANKQVFLFNSLNEKEIIDVFNKQLLTIARTDPFILNNRPVSVNVDSLISDYILNDRYVSDYIKVQKNIAIEINEDFHEFKHPNSFSELSLLSKLCPVWLDDFGRGLTSLKVIKSFQFECIKIDKDYFWEIQHVKDLTAILKKIKLHSNFIIVEGVETIEQKNKVFFVVDSACQGRLWKNNYHYIECLYNYEK